MKRSEKQMDGQRWWQQQTEKERKREIESRQTDREAERERERINLFTAPACKISGLKDARIHLQTVYFPVHFPSTFNAVFWRKSFHVPVWKRRQKGLRVSNFALSMAVFKWHHGSEGVNEKRLEHEPDDDDRKLERSISIYKSCSHNTGAHNQRC